jgi:hypothetical protein
MSTAVTPVKTEALSAQRVQRHIQSRFNPIRGMVPEMLSAQLDQFENGYLRNFALTMSAIADRDDILKAVKPKREKAVSRLGYSIMKLDDSPEAERHKEALEYFYDHLSCVNGMDLNQVGSFKLLVRQMLSAVGYRYAAHEIVWQPSPKGLTAQFRFVPLWFFENTSGKLRFLREDYDTVGSDLADGEWLVTAGDGLMIASSVAWMFKNMPLKDWVAYSEKFGTPGVIAKTGAPKGSAQWNDLAEAVEYYAAEMAAVVSEGTSIELIEAKGGSTLPFPPLIERMDRAMTILWRGGDLGTMAKGDQAVGASLQQSETDLFLEDDAELIGETLNLSVDRFVIRHMFGEGVEPLAFLKIPVPTKRNVEQDLKVDQFLISAGVRLATDDALARYDRTQADEDDEILVAAKPPVSIPGQLLTTEPDMAPDKSMANETASGDRSMILSAVASDMKPICNRLERILQIDDPDILRNRLVSFQRQLPSLLRDINADPASAGAIAAALRQSFVSGLTRTKA